MARLLCVYEQLSGYRRNKRTTESKRDQIKNKTTTKEMEIEAKKKWCSKKIAPTDDMKWMWICLNGMANGTGIYGTSQTPCVLIAVSVYFLLCGIGYLACFLSLILFFLLPHLRKKKKPRLMANLSDRNLFHSHLLFTCC